ncbi:hypothetical protein JXJ21_15135 [candidate division KSB1 bacterium]|nr:hypothetical protein [candidate division KSB1 bacterium]
MVFWALIYNFILIPISYIAFRIASLFAEKVKLGIQGRKRLFPNLTEKINLLPSDKKRIWFHIASYGEFEQAKPVLNALKQESDRYSVIASIFSPSAYENIKSHPSVDVITYLPFDSWFNARKFLSIIRPDAAVFVRHDIWPNHAWQARKQGIPLILFDASLRPDTSRFFPIVRCFNRALFNSFDIIHATTEKDVERLSRLCAKKNNLLLTGDTKYDQARQRSLDTKKLEAVIDPGAFKGKRVLVAGQTHFSDDRHLMPAFSRLLGQIDDLFMILVPHEPTEDYIAATEATFKTLDISSLRLSRYRKHRTVVDFQVLIIDSIGLCANLYGLGEVAFVGGSFRPGIHNVIEPAVYGIPIVFGPRIEVSSEAQELVDRKGALIVNNTQDIFETLRLFFTDETERQRVGNIAQQLVSENIGATQKVVDSILSYL